MPDETKLTYGETAVRFSPLEENTQLLKIRRLGADFIDAIRDYGWHDKRHMKLAIDAMEAAVMWAVKAITWDREKDGDNE